MHSLLVLTSCWVTIMYEFLLFGSNPDLFSFAERFEL